MNHSGNENLSSGSPQQECWLKSLHLIYDTLYTLALAKAAETQHTWWSASLNQTLEEKRCLRCMSESGWVPLHNTKSQRNVNDYMVELRICSEVDSILSPSWTPEFMLLIHALFNQKGKKIIRGSLRAIMTLGQPLRARLSDKVHCIYLCLLLFFCRDSIKRCTKPLLLF